MSCVGVGFGEFVCVYMYSCVQTVRCFHKVFIIPYNTCMCALYNDTAVRLLLYSTVHHTNYDHIILQLYAYYCITYTLYSEEEEERVVLCDTAVYTAV